jgi:hypothetical protein
MLCQFFIFLLYIKFLKHSWRACGGGEGGDNNNTLYILSVLTSPIMQVIINSFSNYQISELERGEDALIPNLTKV